MAIEARELASLVQGMRDVQKQFFRPIDQGGHSKALLAASKAAEREVDELCSGVLGGAPPSMFPVPTPPVVTDAMIDAALSRAKRGHLAWRQAYTEGDRVDVREMLRAALAAGQGSRS